jgi:U6 snRNA-associated Sm-like protein LSm1
VNSPTLLEKLVLVLRDGRKLIGVLRSWDQFGMDLHRILVVLRVRFTLDPNSLLVLANLVLQDTIERLYAGNLYADMARGLFIVRGENVLLLGEIVRFCFFKGFNHFVIFTIVCND